MAPTKINPTPSPNNTSSPQPTATTTPTTETSSVRPISDDARKNGPEAIFREIANDYPHTPAGLEQVAQDPRFKQEFPDAKLVINKSTGKVKDKIDFGSTRDSQGNLVGMRDVILAAGEGGKAWQFLDANPNANANAGGFEMGGYSMGAWDANTVQRWFSTMNQIAEDMQNAKSDDELQQVLNRWMHTSLRA